MRPRRQQWRSGRFPLAPHLRDFVDLLHGLGAMLYAHLRCASSRTTGNYTGAVGRILSGNGTKFSSDPRPELDRNA